MSNYYHLYVQIDLLMQRRSVISNCTKFGIAKETRQYICRSSSLSLHLQLQLELSKYTIMFVFRQQACSAVTLETYTLFVVSPNPQVRTTHLQFQWLLGGESAPHTVLPLEPNMFASQLGRGWALVAMFIKPTGIESKPLHNFM